MCACRQKKSFFIEDILKDVSGKHKPYKSLSQEPTQPLMCNREVPAAGPVATNDNIDKKADEPSLLPNEEKRIKFNVVCEVQKEIELNKVKVNLEQRRNTYPIYPTPIKANVQWPQYRIKDLVSYPVDVAHQFGYFSEPVLNSDQILRSQLANNRYMPHPFTIRQTFGVERVAPGCCTPWWGLGGRRKGGQVRFSAAQTSALERRFSASKYLSPEERRALAATLRLSDRQVKTWFQNRRAKWRRTTPDTADPGSPTSEDNSDDDVPVVTE